MRLAQHEEALNLVAVDMLSKFMVDINALKGTVEHFKQPAG